MSHKVTINHRPCGPLPSRKYPQAYLKSELIELAIDQLDLSHNRASKMTKSELCIRLSNNNPSTELIGDLPTFKFKPIIIGHMTVYPEL